MFGSQERQSADDPPGRWLTQGFWAAQPWREMLRLAWPIAISMLSYSVMTLADTLFVGRLGTASLAGVGLAGTMAFTLICFPMGLLRGVKTLVSQARGANLERAERIEKSYLSATLLIGLAMSVVVIAIGYALLPLISQLSDGAEASVVAREYFAIRVLGTPMLMTYVALREVRYGRGDSRTPMIATVIGNVLNVGLDYLFIFVFDFGAPGAAWATVIAQLVEAAILVGLQIPLGFGFKTVRVRHVREVFSVGLPIGLQFLLEVASFALVVALLAGYSDLETAAHQIALQLIHFSFLPCLAVSEAAGVMSGQLVGAGRIRAVRAVAFRGVVLTIAYALLGVIAFTFFRGQLVSLFTSEAELMHRAGQLLVVAAIFQIFDASLIVAYGTLRGTGDVKVPAMIGIACAWVFTPTLTWFLGLHLEMGALGAWIGLCGEIVFIAIFLWWRLLSFSWRDVARRQRRVAANAS